MAEDFEHLYSAGAVLEARAEIEVLDSSGDIIDRIQRGTHCVVFLAGRSSNEQYYGMRKYDNENHNVLGGPEIYLHRDLVECGNTFKPLGNLRLDDRKKEWFLTLLNPPPIPASFILPEKPSTRH